MADETPASKSEAVAFSILEHFLEVLTAEAGRSPEPLSVESIEALARRFKENDSKESLARFHKYFDECLRQHEKDIWDEARKRPFDRLLVKRFSRLFSTKGEMDSGTAVISRRILPGFFLAVEMMAGKELFDQCQSACKGIVKAKKKQVGADFHWRIIYEDENARELVNDLFSVISSHFADFEKRAEWLRDLINSHLAPPENYAFEGEHVQDWSLGRDGTLALLRELFAPFEEMLADTEGRRHIEERYGLKACQTIEELVGNFKRET